jgi:mono/diheme cytochrome c family protein
VITSNICRAAARVSIDWDEERAPAIRRRSSMTRKLLNLPFVLTAAVSLFACQYIFSRSDNVPKNILVKKNPVAESDAVLAKAQTSYNQRCVQCHGREGRGDGPMAGMTKEKPVDLTNRANMAAMTDGEIFWIITKGDRSMPAFESKLTDEDRWGLIHLLRSMSHTSPPTTPQQN